MHPVPQKFPVKLTDGTRVFEVFNATDYVNAVFGSGHTLFIEPEAASAPQAAPAAPVPAPTVVVPATATVVAPATNSTDSKAK